jgi:mitochondrial fission protein ELM1
MGPGGHIRPETHGNLPQLAVTRGHNAGVLQVDLRQLQRRFGVLNIRLQRPRLTITVCRS